ncbi:MAG: hypothetical protein JSU72_04665 [Deltaproteobacteria bacterium]|nr:MAG: hypothetical protein JSU72_04665 [Deltaproteobacteria bacterium]
MRRLLLSLVMVLVWFLVANSTCDRAKRQEPLTDSYHLARFHLMECQDMGAGDLDPDGMNEAMRLSEEIERALAKDKKSSVRASMVQLQESVALLLERMREWDADEDGLSNYAEFMLYGTSWSNEDSDGDGYLDGNEILRYDTDPLDYCGVPVNTPTERPVKHRCPALEEQRHDIENEEGAVKNQ